MLAAGVCLSADTPAATDRKPPQKDKVKAELHKKADIRQSNAKLVEVTGSRLKYRVKEGEEKTATPLTVTVLDPKSPINRGYASPIEMLTRMPSVYRGR
jgi:orotate phosphoribosyltransferase-like protein